MKRRERIAPLSDENEYDLTEEQEAVLEAAIADIDRGEFVDADELLAELRARRIQK